MLGLQIAVDLPKPHTPATVAEWAEEMLPEFLKQEKETRLAAEKVAAEKEAKRLAARNESKVGRSFLGTLDVHCSFAVASVLSQFMVVACLCYFLLAFSCFE